MSLWRFNACIEGWNRAQGGEEKAAPPSNEEFEQMKAAHAAIDARRNGRG